MLKHFNKLNVSGGALLLSLLGGAAMLALPIQASVQAQSTNATTSNGISAFDNTHLAAAQLRTCQNREKAISTIMTRIDTRGQKQITLFNTIATRVESFYASKDKPVSDYNQLATAVATARAQAETDLNTLQASSTFSCSANNPKGIVTAFRAYLKTEISDLQNYRTTIKNLIVAVGSANGVTVSESSHAKTQGGK